MIKVLRITTLLLSFFTTLLYAEATISLLESSDSLCHIGGAIRGVQLREAPTLCFGKAAHSVSVDSLPQRAIVFKAALPYVPLSIVIPAGKEIDQLQYIAHKSHDKQGIRPMYHLPHDGMSDHKGAKAYYESADTATVELVSVQRVSGVSIAIIHVYPLRFNGNETLTIDSTFDLLVSFKESDSIEEAAVYGEAHTSLPILNRDQIYSYDSREQRASYDFLILSTETLFSYDGPNSIGALQDLRERQGFRVKRVTLSEILSSTSGVDTPKKIRTYLQKKYKEWGFDYLLIIGDHSVVPARILTPNSNPLWGAKAERMASDLYYQCLDGVYNSNGDEHWGDRYDSNVDIMPEFSIGRAPVESVEELQNFICKTVQHEKQSSCEKALIAAEPLGLKGISSTDHMNEIVKGSSLHDHTTKGFNSLSSTDVLTQYGEQNEWGKSSMIGWINSNSYSLLNHLGHGYSNTVMLLKNGDESLLANTELPFLYTQACLSGKFDNDCIAERLLTSNRSGFWGAVMNSATGKINGEKRGPSQLLNRFFWDAWFSKKKKLVGDMNRYSHEMCVPMKNATDMTHCIYSSNLLGDPTAPIVGSGTTAAVSQNSIQYRVLSYSLMSNRTLFIDGSREVKSLSLYTINGKKVFETNAVSPIESLPQSIAPGFYCLEITAAHGSVREIVSLK